MEGIKDMDSEHDFNNIVTQSNTIINLVNNINEDLAKTSFQYNKNNMGGVLSKVIKDEYKNLTFYTNLENLFKEANIIANQLVNFKNTLQSTEYFEIEKLKSIRKAERIDMWKLWRDKLGRWLLGGFAAITLYSALVLLSEKYEFFKVPVRDLVVQKQKSEIPINPVDIKGVVSPITGKKIK